MSHQSVESAADGISPWLTSFMGLSSVFAAIGMVSHSNLGSGVKLFVLGSLVETGRRLCQWLIVRFRIQYAVTAHFSEGDSAYEWMVLLVTQEEQTQDNAWRRSRDFTVTATNSRRKWAVQTWVDPNVKGHAEYVPTYEHPQLFRWRGYWVEIRRRAEPGSMRYSGSGVYQELQAMTVTMYTLDMNALSGLVEDARARYVEVNRPNVIIHLADASNFGPSLIWNIVKHKVRRPLSSIILEPGVVDTLVHDAQDFLASEDWYVEAGIPHRRGYLLHGPPGTGKTSTIYALAGALNLEIYSLSLASSFVDDAFLQRAASSIPKNALFLIEDIDCAFASREDDDEGDMRARPGNAGINAGDAARSGRPLVSLSGLLNVIDGVGSEEGKLFFATTNYIDRLDPALLRPGRIDHKVAYELSTVRQAHALFLRFFPSSRFPAFADVKDIKADIPADAPDSVLSSEKSEEAERRSESDKSKSSQSPQEFDGTAPTPPTHPPASAPAGTLSALAVAFAAAIPPGEFSTAELQCYLQAHKTAPAGAVAGACAWVAKMRTERHARGTGGGTR
ncbi:P-loop containing nucleoside triphosphate hydrolase protein [Mycena belliarum]|uniref:P-loop containing nucleoside triphosphate hydrolase protein n=1 Tax=Mycena belliarum TaxID=1033014 RepID=A0AAD6UK35_9AGAR|nr:P-loop containing nucleoside triphosphate hydrolase protein [Mycena belliae]